MTRFLLSSCFATIVVACSDGPASPHGFAHPKPAETPAARPASKSTPRERPGPKPDERRDEERAKYPKVGGPTVEVVGPDVPKSIREAVGFEREDDESLDISAIDVNLGRPAWLVTKYEEPKDRLNQPMWIFGSDGHRWRKLAFLGYVENAEAVVSTGKAPRALRVQAKIGVFRAFGLFRYRSGVYRVEACTEQFVTDGGEVAERAASCKRLGFSR